ncbi:flagellar export protein FliJ [Fluviispira multicolorata]|uniref:Flagellar FliJ protein n=1 Tax=Fluviispira multicolorata TaxID=2654512 RepID=A0A833JGI7_9BACT|nr:flagellar export protein FliJ [Fluviispira multicolorata]KAB8032156.1 flagellar export protein FliJ [Fluviispira multicolorata]
MSFRFSLQRILNLREQETIDAELRVEYAKRVIAELKNMIHKERDLYFSDRDELNLCVQKAQIHKVTIYERSLNIRQGRIMELLDNLRSCQSDLEVYQQTLIQARRNQKIIEKLKEIKEKEFRRKESYKEQSVLDEVGNQKYLRTQFQEKGEE